MPALRKPIEVILEASHGGTCPDGSPYYFVLIVNVPFVKGKQKACVITDARPRPQAEAIKAAVEQALHIYRQPKRKRVRKPKTAWERITKDRGGL